MSTRRRRPKQQEEDDHPDERWMASYMDMVTVLMCMFIVLFAMSTVDAEKFAQLKESLATGFGAAETQTVDTAVGVVVPPDMVDDKETLEPEASLAALAAQEVEDLTELRDAIYAGLQEKGLEDSVRFEIDERGLTIRLVSSDMFFDPDMADLTAEAVQVLDTVGPALAPTTYEVSVEGHTAQVRQFADNALDWELSSARSVNVLRYLVSNGKVTQERVKAVGYGEARPLTPGKTPEELARNRRVDIVVLSGQREDVRSLLPAIAAEQADDPAS
ncbi:OmpA family protein [Arthrobacter yangruifuii]|uniref:OmpA family protein n=1 Tax=Arthrobacter yangruifuii TaxID=2606616 RepID=A0A5N6MEW5_9MICC|nr:flagellar motor protein MotB [Arthrobacter yangruifuii]KAD3456125.1 OmpA family protein [Arthrobacter yangruifuii]